MTLEGTILAIDDDAATRALLVKLLSAQDYTVKTAGTLDEGLAKIADDVPDLVLLDIKMPDGDGRHLCRRLRAHPDTADVPIILMTAHTESGRLWISTGADAIVYKPFKHEEVLSWVRALVYARRAQAKLDRMETMLVSIAASVEARSEHRKEHLFRVAWYSQQIAYAMGLTHDDVTRIRRAALLHDIGMLAVPDALLHQPRSLTPTEFAQVKAHPVVGAELCRALPDGDEVSTIIRSHHERWHGGGYPDGLAGVDIPLGARIIAAADAFDTLTTDRPYRSALTVEGALDVLILGSGAQWDPDVVEKLTAIVHPHRDHAARIAPDSEQVARASPNGDGRYDPLEAFIKYLQITGDRQ
jgi:putative two-component system response regulator